MTLGNLIYWLVEQGPTSEHILGTDASGRDNFARLLYGARVSLIVGFSAMLFTLVYWFGHGCVSWLLWWKS